MTQNVRLVAVRGIGSDVPHRHLTSTATRCQVILLTLITFLITACGRDQVLADGGSVGPWQLRAIHAAQAWRHSTGKGAVIAIVDTGLVNVRLLHLRVVWAVNLERPATAVTDVNGHGTEMAVIAAGRHLDEVSGIGISGVAPGASIMPIQVTDAEGRSTPARLAAGILWAVDHGADVINISMASDVETAVVDEAIRSALDHSVIIVAAAGDLGTADLRQPAAVPGVVAVAAVGRTGKLTPTSNYDPGRSVNAPGIRIPTLRVIGGELLSTFAGGTSAACAVVSGLAALAVAAARPRRLTGQEFLNALRRASQGRLFVDAAKLVEEVAQRKFLLPGRDGATRWHVPGWWVRASQPAAARP